MSRSASPPAETPASPPRTSGAAASPYGSTRPGRERSILTPDGVRLTVRIADLSSRFAAALMDLTIIFLGVLTLGAVVALILDVDFRFLDENSVFASGFGLALFLTRVFYFPYFEIRWGGRTPGKRALGIRVVDRNGVGLTGEAVLARNLVREAEFFFPLGVVISQPNLTGDPVANVLAYIFILLIIALPLLNNERMRGGDILAGSWVVYEEAPALLPDLAAAPREARDYSFTDAQLRTYGLKELETLAAVLRDQTPNAPELREKVAATIQKKIGWKPGAGETPEAFLAAFYAALRGALERRKAATGYAPEDKHAAPGAGRASKP